MSDYDDARYLQEYLLICESSLSGELTDTQVASKLTSLNTVYDGRISSHIVKNSVLGKKDPTEQPVVDEWYDSGCTIDEEEAEWQDSEDWSSSSC